MCYNLRVSEMVSGSELKGLNMNRGDIIVRLDRTCWRVFDCFSNALPDSCRLFDPFLYGTDGWHGLAYSCDDPSCRWLFDGLFVAGRFEGQSRVWVQHR